MFIIINIDYVSIYLNTNSVFKIKKPINPPFLNIARKVTTPFIFILPKSFANLTLYLNLTYLKHSISIKIILMLSTVILPSFLYQTIGNLTLNLISLDSSCFSRLYKYLLIMIPYWSIPWLLFLTLGSAEKLYIRADFVISLCTEDSAKRNGMLNGVCLMLLKLQYVIYLIFIAALNIVLLSPVNVTIALTEVIILLDVRTTYFYLQF